jgi:hypothetical protein
MFFIKFGAVKVSQKSAKSVKMTNKKPLSEYQKQRLGVALEALQNPIFSTLIVKASRKSVRPFLLFRPLFLCNLAIEVMYFGN